MMQVISTWYPKNLAVETRKGMKEKGEKVAWPKLTQPRYLNRHDKSSSWIEVDPELGLLIAKAFSELVSGNEVKITLASTALNYEVKEWLNTKTKDMVGKLPGVKKVEIALSD